MGKKTSFVSLNCITPIYKKIKVNHLLPFALLTACQIIAHVAMGANDSLNVNFLGSTVKIPFFDTQLDPKNIDFGTKGIAFLDSAFQDSEFTPLLEEFESLRKKLDLDDWFFYQLIRRTAECIIPKRSNYLGYTYCKWLLLRKAGYNALLRLSEKKVLLYVMSNDTIYNVPYLKYEGQQFVCLNYHDYSHYIDFTKETFRNVGKPPEINLRAFSYRITHLPEFTADTYSQKQITFDDRGESDYYEISFNAEMQNYFKNYPVTDFRYQFSIPFSQKNYQSLIPSIRKKINKMDTINGVEYIMRFVRYAFAFQRDNEIYGLEKRFSAEETLMSEKSDCEDRSALFFALVKVLYDLPMIVLSYPEHVTVAVHLNGWKGKSLDFNGISYTLCEPTPQKRDLKLGEQMPELLTKPFEVVLEYTPDKK